MRTAISKVYKFMRRIHILNRLEFMVYRILGFRKNSLYFSNYGNFGDELNEDLMQYFDIPYTHIRPLGADMCCIGSNLQHFVNKTSKPVSKRHHLSVLGSGFISEATTDEHFIFDMKIYGLRGKLTKQRCEKIMDKKLEEVVLGDPGLLIRRIYPYVKRNRKFDIGVICHMEDKNSKLLQNINLQNKKILFIDIELDPKTFVEQVAQCSFVLSSAMHGLICADSLGIPNKHIILSNKVVGGEYKFRDYYSVFTSFNYNPVYLEDRVITNEDIENYKNEYNISSYQVEYICNNIQAEFEKYKMSQNA